MKWRLVGMVVFNILFMLAGLAVYAALFELVWNSLFVSALDAKVIDYWQAGGFVIILVLLRAYIKSLRGK